MSDAIHVAQELSYLDFKQNANICNMTSFPYRSPVRTCYFIRKKTHTKEKKKIGNKLSEPH